MLGFHVLGIFLIFVGTPKYGMIKCISLEITYGWKRLLNSVLKINIYRNGEVTSENHPKAKYTKILKLNLGPINILIYCLKNLEQYLLNLEPQITISQSKLGDGVASQNLKELAMSAIRVK